MALPTYTLPVDGSILLYPNEQLLATQQGVGIYDGPHKSAPHQSGIVSLTSHRLFYIDNRAPEHDSFALDLVHVTQTDYYAGLFTSSPKITLHLARKDHSRTGPDSWDCDVCGNTNRSPSSTQICVLCGVLRSPPSISVVSSSSSTTSVACPACTFMNHPSLAECEICDTKLVSPDPPDIDDQIKISFRKGGDKAFYTTLKQSLKSKAWETRLSDTLTDNNAIARSGITGILQSVESSAQGQDIHVKSALQDLEALMIKARDMVQLAAGLNEKLNSITTDSTPVLELPEEAVFIRSSLAQLGLQVSNVPVTNDMITDEKKWVHELARELAEVLGGMMSDRGIIALDEVWGGWNRARGVALLPPSTFLQVIPLLPQYTSPPIQMRQFRSGLLVLHTPSFSLRAFGDRLKVRLLHQGPKTTMEIALMEGLTVALTKAMIEEVEMEEGDVVREVVYRGGGDCGLFVSGVRWWPNVFVDYVWDGHE